MIMLCAIVFLLWSSVDVNSQTVPYITFMGVTLPNSSYVDVSLVGNPLSGGGVQCHTDMTTCCSRHQGMDRGDWYAPNGGKLAFHQSGDLNSTFERRESQKVTLYHRSSALPSDHQSGMYRCDIAVNGSGRGTVYIGIYETGGDITMLGISLSTHSVLTCISTGGPATNVTWTRGSDEDNLVPVSESTSVSVLVNATTAQYIHTLNVSGTKLPAVYGCSVSNDKPSSAKVVVTIGSMSSSISNIVAGESVNLTCTATFGSEDSVRYVWSGPAVNNNGSNHILSLHNIHLSEAGEYKCSASIHNSSITADIPVVLQFPQPTVIFKGNDSDPVYAGTEFVLNISITFSENFFLDVRTIFSFVLSRGNMSSNEQANVIVNDDRITLWTDNEMGVASLTYSPIAITDSGWITATVTVSSCNDSFIQPITATSSYSLYVEDLPDPELTISGPTTAIAGEQLVLTCTVRVVEHLISVHSVEWSGGSVGRGDGVIESNTTNNGVISEKTLTFNLFHTSHGALYTCMADIIDQSINLTKNGKEDVHLVVQLPQPIIVIRRSHSGLVFAGKNFTLNAEISFSDSAVVDVSISLAICWSRDGDIITSNDRITMSNVSDNKRRYTASLAYSPIATSDSGLITATVTVSPSNDSMYIQSVNATANDTLCVQDSVPDVNISLSRNTPLYSGTTLNLTCTATVHFNVSTGEEITATLSGPGDITGERNTISQSTFSRGINISLTISPLTVEDEGVYTCNMTVSGESRSQCFNASDEVWINVLTLPEPQVAIIQKGSLTAGHTAHLLNCSVIFEPHLEVEPSFTWTRQDSTSQSIGSEQHLNFTSLRTSDSGNYTCTVTIDITDGISVSGKDTLNLIVAIPAPDVVVTASNTTSLYVGSSLTLACTVTLNPNVDNDETITTLWSVPSYISGERYFVINATGSGVVYTSNLTFTSLVHEDNGTYTCTGIVTGKNEEQVTASANHTLSIDLGHGGSPVTGVVVGTIFVILLTVAIVILGIVCSKMQVCRRLENVRSKPLPTLRRLNYIEPGRQTYSGEVEMKGLGAFVDYDNDDYYFEDPSIIVTGRNDVHEDDFPDLVKQMHEERDRQFELEYRSLDGLSGASCEVAYLSCNLSHNRFRNIYPYDHTRVELKKDPEVEGSDYINASFIDGYPDKKQVYIATQGPMLQTLERFWRMVWEYQLTTIVMLTRCVEDGKAKCMKYWPDQVHTTLNVGSMFTVTLTSTIPSAEYQISKLQVNSVSDPGHDMIVTHMHYTAWPDHGVPENAMSVISFIRRVRREHPHSLNQALLVHCSAGVGRTGTFILLDTVMQQMKNEGTLSIYNILKNVRDQRMKMVQTKAQYVFIHDALSELVVCGETDILAANIRININHMKECSTGEAITGFQKQFQILQRMSSQYQASYIVAKAEYNGCKNRFPHKLPNDANRVKLSGGPQPGSDYINASFIDGYKHCRAYIAAQGPLQNTVNDFWRMVWEHHCSCIVLLCDTEETDMDSCHCFWPQKSEVAGIDLAEEVYGKLTVTLKRQSVYGDITEWKLEVTENEEKMSTSQRMVTLLQLTSWPIDELPHPSSILSLIDLLGKAQRNSSSRHTVIMCSDGVGRTGTFICIHSQMERLKTEGVVDFFQAAKSACIQRAGLIPDDAHYAFSHEVVNSYVDSFQTYANFKDVV